MDIYINLGHHLEGLNSQMIGCYVKSSLASAHLNKFIGRTPSFPIFNVFIPRKSLLLLSSIDCNEGHMKKIRLSVCLSVCIWGQKNIGFKNS